MQIMAERAQCPLSQGRDKSAKEYDRSPRSGCQEGRVYPGSPFSLPALPDTCRRCRLACVPRTARHLPLAYLAQEK